MFKYCQSLPTRWNHDRTFLSKDHDPSWSQQPVGSAVRPQIEDNLIRCFVKFLHFLGLDCTFEEERIAATEALGRSSSCCCYFGASWWGSILVYSEYSVSYLSPLTGNGQSLSIGMPLPSWNPYILLIFGSCLAWFRRLAKNTELGSNGQNRWEMGDTAVKKSLFAGKSPALSDGTAANF